MTALTALEHEDLPRRDVSFDLLRGEGGSRKIRGADLVDFRPSFVQNSPRPLQPLLVDSILPSSLWSSDRSMNQSAGGSQLKRESEVSVDQRVGLKVGSIGSGIRRIKRRQSLLEQSEIEVGPTISQGRDKGEEGSEQRSGVNCE